MSYNVQLYRKEVKEKELNDRKEDFFENEDDASALLTNRALYFSASGEGIFEISMTASEFTDTGEFAKYDPQAGGW